MSGGHNSGPEADYNKLFQILAIDIGGRHISKHKYDGTKKMLILAVMTILFGKQNDPFQIFSLKKCFESTCSFRF